MADFDITSDVQRQKNLPRASGVQLRDAFFKYEHVIVVSQKIILVQNSHGKR